MLDIFSRKYLNLLSCNLINKKIKLYSHKRFDNDIKFRFEYEGSYLKEYYMEYKDAVLVVKLNTGNMILKQDKYMVYSLNNQILCIVSS